MKQKLHKWLFPGCATREVELKAQVLAAEQERDWLRKILGDIFERRDAAAHKRVQEQIASPQRYRNWPAHLRNGVGVKAEGDGGVVYTETGIRPSPNRAVAGGE